MMDLKHAGNIESAELATCTMLMHLLESLAEFHDECTVSMLPSGKTTVFVVDLTSQDLQILRGGSGRTAKSLELLVGAMGAKAQRTFSLIFRKKSEPARDGSAALPVITQT